VSLDRQYSKQRMASETQPLPVESMKRHVTMLATCARAAAGGSGARAGVPRAPRARALPRAAGRAPG